MTNDVRRDVVDRSSQCGGGDVGGTNGACVRHVHVEDVDLVERGRSLLLRLGQTIPIFLLRQCNARLRITETTLVASKYASAIARAARQWRW
jgi:hypothetical protein